jgi:hypothetical protein
MDLKWPSEADIELPLLQAILRRGGWIYFSVHGEELEADLADHFRLSNEHREYASIEIRAKGHRKWRNMLQWVRLHLINKGHLEPGVRDVWKVSDAGRTRCQKTGMSDAEFERAVRAEFPGMSDACILAKLEEFVTVFQLNVPVAGTQSKML